ncbi:MAG TPA: nucleotide disphospho-sugar-binding domain-containing protein [Thermoleophilaceae bacterium]|nr:nucleotide disphospho-sugar-binding domain-containing protein [Thermoleophilaceae bacterium]
MTRFLAYTSPARGHLYPLVPTLRELKKRGHEVAVRTLASEVELLRDLGFDAAPIDPAIEGPGIDDWRAKTPIGAVKRSLAGFFERARHDGPDLRRAVEEERPDALLVDVNTWGAAAAASVGELPWASWCPYFLPLPSKDAPPFGPGFAPAKGVPGHVRDRLASSLLERFWNGALPALNEVRRDLGAPPLASVIDAMREPPLTLYLTAEPFEYHHSDWPDSIVMTGPGVWDPPADPPQWLGEITKPLVLVTCSTEFQDDGKLVAVALEGLQDEDVHVVATTAGVDPAQFGVPANARVERFVPHAPLVERATCVVCHGGLGITQKALAAGVPVCVVPFGRDQLEVARRVEIAGAGTRLAAPRLTPKRLRQAVREAVSRRDGAQRLAEAFARAGGPAAAADALERKLDRQPSAAL